MKHLAALGLSAVAAAPALAHPGGHVHPHDGAHWLAVVAALAMLAVGGTAVAVRRRRRK